MNRSLNYSDNHPKPPRSVSLRRRLPPTPGGTPETRRRSQRGLSVTNSDVGQRDRGCYSSQVQRKAYKPRSELEPDWLTVTDMRQPLRSQSFRHRTKPLVEVKRNALEEVSQERRRSTPTVSRRCSLQKGRLGPTDRTDVWPEPKHPSEIEERFLKLPDSEDYTRVRQFKIDSKGAVVNRGDSFRRKRNRQVENSPSPYPGEDDSPRGTESRSVSVSSGASLIGRGQNESDVATTSHNVYKIYVLGTTGSGKSALISQFITSEYRNAFADEIEVKDNMVSINIGSHECDLVFFEADPTMDPTWKHEDVQAYLLVYSIDSKSSFKTATATIEEIRELNNGLPIILAGNKIDLERKRAISSDEVKNIALTHGVAHFEISVALNHDVDDLLVGIVAETKESFKIEKINDENRPIVIKPELVEKITEADDFRAAIRRFSQRKKRQMGIAAANLESDASKCTNLSPTNLFEKFRNWRRGISKC